MSGWRYDPDKPMTHFGTAESDEPEPLDDETPDMVNHPPHYTSDPSGVECIEITRHRNFNVGNAIKYLWRAGLKEDAKLNNWGKQIEDLEKAIFYIEDEIHRLSI